MLVTHSCPLDATLITVPRLSLSAHSCLYFATTCVSNYSCDLDFGSLLLIEYVAATAVGYSAENAIQRKDKRKLPIPVRTVYFTVSAQIDASFLFASFAAGDIAQRKCVAIIYPMLSINVHPPGQPYFMYTVKWAVMQYVVLRPIVSITGIVCQVYGVLCESVGFVIGAIHFANIYLEAIDFVSITCVLA